MTDCEDMNRCDPGHTLPMIFGIRLRIAADRLYMTALY